MSTYRARYVAQSDFNNNTIRRMTLKKNNGKYVKCCCTTVFSGAYSVKSNDGKSQDRVFNK